MLTKIIDAAVLTMVSVMWLVTSASTLGWYAGLWPLMHKTRHQ